MIDIDNAHIYVGTYSKYNNGSLFGKWMSLSKYSDIGEFHKACKELHKDEEDPELMFQDWENIPDALIGECWLSEKFFPLRDSIKMLNKEQQKAFFIWFNNESRDISKEDTDILVSIFQDGYCGKYDNEEDYAMQYVEDCHDLPEFAKTYFDYKKFADELFSTDYWFEDGYVFRK